MLRLNNPSKKWFDLPWLQTLAHWWGQPTSRAEKSLASEPVGEVLTAESLNLSQLYVLQMLAAAATPLEREQAIKVAIASGMPLSEIERQLEQLDIQSK